VGQAIGAAAQGGPARPFATQIVRAADASFVSGLHIVGVVAAGVTLLAAIGVALFLPARARDPEPLTADADRVPVGAGVA
jgi:hypothetical protein